MRHTFVIIYLSWMLVHAPDSSVATPVTHPLGKRGAISCQPINPIQQLSFQDCLSAFYQMSQAAQNLHRIVSFGIGPHVDVSINGDPLIWEYGTCAIELQAQGNVPQLSSWQNIRIQALQIAHRCANRHRQGHAYIDRIHHDRSPAAVAEGPSLQVWVGPTDVPDEMVEDLGDKKSIEGSCSVNDHVATQMTSGSSQMMDSATTESSVIGGSGRGLLNSASAGCGNATGPVVHNLTSSNAP